MLSNLCGLSSNKGESFSGAEKTKEEYAMSDKGFLSVLEDRKLAEFLDVPEEKLPGGHLKLRSHRCGRRAFHASTFKTRA